MHNLNLLTKAYEGSNQERAHLQGNGGSNHHNSQLHETTRLEHSLGASSNPTQITGLTMSTRATSPLSNFGQLNGHSALDGGFGHNSLHKQVRERTIGKSVKLIQQIASKTWEAQWRGDKVAVKIFSDEHKHIWIRETEMFQEINLRCENVVCFIASDIVMLNAEASYYLITKFYSQRSVLDYLKTLPGRLDSDTCFSLSLGLINGLAFLHQEIPGTQGKPSIAHRAISPENVLIKTDANGVLTCCISKFYLAAIQKNSGADSRVEGMRLNEALEHTGFEYQPPEYKNNTNTNFNFESFKQADVYSAALVMYEVLTCCTKRYLPFSQDFGFDLNEFHVSADKYLQTIAQIIEEAAVLSPMARISALRMRKTIEITLDAQLQSVDAFTRQ